MNNSRPFLAQTSFPEENKTSISWRTFQRVLCLLACNITISLVDTSAKAASFQEVIWRGKKVIQMSGQIDVGTFERFSAIAGSVPAQSHGLPVLLLDSGGGRVDEAMKISKFLQKRKFHTVIPNGAQCASACASVIFIAGHYRTVEPFGLLGQHSCSRAGLMDAKCNEELGMHAIENGVSHGSVSAFITDVPPEQILWFSREDADGWGLTRYPRSRENGFMKSEPRFFRLLSGKFPDPQSAWRVDFFEDGWRAFSRPVADHIREMQMNLYCRASNPGRLFLSMEIHGSADVVRGVVHDVQIGVDKINWQDTKPSIVQTDSLVTEVITEIPRRSIIAFLRESTHLKYHINVKPPYKPMIAYTRIDQSRDALIFAANNCAGGIGSPR